MSKIENIENVELRYLTVDDFEELKVATLESYGGVLNSYWKKHHIEKLTSLFPEGQVVILVDGDIAGCALSLIVDFDSIDDDHTYNDIIEGESFKNHNPEGDVLYGIDVFIKPQYRGLRLGRRLYDYRKEVCEKLNLKSIVFGGRMPNYHKHKELTPKQYIEKVKQKEIHDPVLNFSNIQRFSSGSYIEGLFRR